MRNTGGSGRSKTSKDKGSSKTAQPQTQNINTVKSEGPPLKTVQPTAEQMAWNHLIQSKDGQDDADLQNKISQIMDLTGCTQEKAEIAFFDSKNDMDRAVNSLLEGAADESEWRESGKKKKKPKVEAAPPPVENNVENKPDRRDQRDRNDRDNRERNRDETENGEKPFRESSDNYRQKPRRNDNRPPRLARGRGRPDRGGDRSERDGDSEKDEDNRDRGFDRGRGRGRGFGRRGGRGGPGGQFRPSRGGFENKNSQFDNGPHIDTWTNETAVIGEKEPKISNWGDSKEDWNEDIDSWTGSLAETKVFTATGSSVQEPASQMQMPDSNSLSNTFDLGALYQKHTHNDLSAEASYISQFNQQATESIKNSIGIGSGQNSSLQNSMSSQTASNVSALVSLQQNAMQDNLGSSLNELTGNGLSGSGLTGTSLVGTSLVNSSTSLPVNNLTSSALHSTSLHSTSLSGDLTVNSLTSLSGTSLAGNSLTGTNVSGSGLTGSLTGNSLSAGSQSVSGLTGVIPSSSVSQNAMLQQRQKPQRSKLPPPSKIPASAVEMPGHVMTTLDVQFGSLEFGADSSENAAFSFGGNESVNSAFSSSETKSSSTINDHIGSKVGSVPAMSKANEALISAALEQSSPRNSSLYQQSPYSTPTKQNSTESTNKINSPPEPLQMPGASTDLKSKQLNQNVSLPSTKIDASLGSYSAGSGYQSSSYQSQKASTPAGYQPTNKSGSYSGNQFQSTSVQNQSNSSQFSSQYRQPTHNQYPSGGNQFASGSQFQPSQSGFQTTQTGYQSSQSGYQSNQSQYQSNQNQFQNFQSGSTFQNQSSFSSNQTNQTGLYPSTTTASYGTNQSQQNSLYSQNSRTGSYSNQSYLNEHGAGAGSSFQTPVTQSNSAFKENQSGASSFRDNVQSSVKSRDIQSEGSTYSRDTQSASSFSDSQSMAYNRDSQSVGNYSRDPGSSFKRDTKSASGSYPRDTSSSDSSYSRDSQSASASYTGRDSQSASYRDRDIQSGSSGYGGQAGSYPRETGSQSQTQTGYSAKTYRNTTEVTSALTGSKLVDSFSKMAVKDGSLDSIQSTNTQFDGVSNTTKTTTNATSLATSVTSSAVSSTGTTVISSTTTKSSTLPSASAASTKAQPSLPPGVPLMAQQYIMSQGTLPFYGLQSLQGLQQPMYNLEDFQFLQQRMPPLPTGSMYDLSATAAAAGLPIPPTTLTSNSSQQTIPTVPYSGSNDSSKLPRVDAQSPTGSVTSNSQPSGTGQSATHQQPYIHLNYGYYYPPLQIPGAGFQYPMIPMPQVTNAAHTGTPANTQYQQKNYGSHVQYGTNKMYEDLTVAQTGGDFTKSPYGSTQPQPKANINSSAAVGSGASTDIQIPGYGAKTHAQAFDKQGFHAGTPPPFNLQLAAGQLTTGTQAGPLGAPTAAYGAPYVPLMPHQPHSQMMHHPIQDGTSSSRGSQQSSGQSKAASKAYTSPPWGSYSSIQ